MAKDATRTMQELGERIFPELKSKRGGRDKLYDILNAQEVDFDIADRVLCYLDETLLWLEDPVLREAYITMDLKGLDKDRPVVLGAA